MGNSLKNRDSEIEYEIELFLAKVPGLQSLGSLEAATRTYRTSPGTVFASYGEGIEGL